jgi:hypothetical protein
MGWEGAQGWPAGGLAAIILPSKRVGVVPISPLRAVRYTSDQGFEAGLSGPNTRTSYAENEIEELGYEALPHHQDGQA